MIEVIAVTDARWAAFVEVHRDATCFHRPEWAELLAKCYRYRAFVAVQLAANGTIVAGMPVMEVRQLSGRRRWVCLPFSDECPPLTSTESSVAELVADVDELRRRAGADHLEIRAELPVPGCAGNAVAVTHAVDVDTDIDHLFTLLSSSARRNVRKAERDGVTVRRSTELSDVERFYELHLRTRRRQGVPVQPRRYFHLLWEGMISAGRGAVLLAEHRDVTVAGAVFLAGGRTMTYKYGASDPAHWRLNANSLVIWTAMAWAVKSGCAIFDWGRSGLEDTGLREFKSRFGGQERPLIYTRLPAGVPKIGGTSTRILRPVIAHAPVWVCRAVGELAYRFAG